MIRFTLVCDQAHEFESWFPSGAAFDEQARRGLVACPLCDSVRVSKAIMAPNVARTDRGETTTPPAGDADARQSVALVDDKMRALHAMVRELRDKIISQTTDVGAAFAEEARRMHAGEAEERPIRGQASVQEARALADEGISVLPIPVLPEDRN